MLPILFVQEIGELENLALLEIEHELSLLIFQYSCETHNRGIEIS